MNELLEIPGPLSRDPESHFVTGRDLAYLGEAEQAVELLSRALDGGYRCYHSLLHDPWLAALHSHPRFADLVNRAAALDLEARKVFVENGGNQLLGVQIDCDG